MPFLGFHGALVRCARSIKASGAAPRKARGADGPTTPVLAPLEGAGDVPRGPPLVFFAPLWGGPDAPGTLRQRSQHQSAKGLPFRGFRGALAACTTSASTSRATCAAGASCACAKIFSRSGNTPTPRMCTSTYMVTSSARERNGKSPPPLVFFAPPFGVVQSRRAHSARGQRISPQRDAFPWFPRGLGPVCQVHQSLWRCAAESQRR
mmetsp:Transcript_7844/g.17103  ORF Transcript_7844/g.17103 Transcript_7844/m.17103 type:complete len:207 (+) Transcript_7844:286-906(+)